MAESSNGSHYRRPGEALAQAAGICARLLKAPMAAIGIRGQEGRWTNYLFGLDREWEHREPPFAAEALASTGIFIRSGSVPGHDSIGFMAAVPLGAPPDGLGILAIFDIQRRELTNEQLRTLSELGGVLREALGIFNGPRVPGSSHERAASLSMRLDLSGRIISADPLTEERLGYDPGRLAGRPLSDIVEPSESMLAMDSLLAQLGSGGWLSNNLRLLTRTGDPVMVRAHTHLEFERGVPVAVDFIASDYSSEAVRMEALRYAEQALTEKAEELAHFSEHLRQLHRLATTGYSSLTALFTDYLRSGCEILRMPLGLVTGLTGEPAAFRAVYPSDPDLDESAMSAMEHFIAAQMLPEHQTTFSYPWDAEGEKPALELDSPFSCLVGTPVYAGSEIIGALSFCSTQAEDVRHFSAQEREILELMAKSLGRSIYEERLRGEGARLTLELERQAQQDSLTGLCNRLQFMKQLESALATAAQRSGTLAIGFIDLDRFKEVNDTMGHAMGDEVLRQVGSRLFAAVGPEECVARVGGDEFTVLFGDNPTREGVAVIAERLLQVLREPYTVEQAELFVTASMGISFFPDDGENAKDLLQRADAAMYYTKGQGKDAFRFFTPNIAIRGASRMALETQLRRALEKGELRMCFMPLVSVEAGTLESLETLLAWKNPRFGNVGPSRFIPIAEESGMIIPIGAWVLTEACRQAVCWQSRDIRPIRIAINVSALQFARPGFVEIVSAALRESGLAPQYLELELTESIIMRDVESAARRMSRLRDVGVSIAIDDFGTGYSSLSYLRRLPVDTLKIDQSFVAELGASTAALPLIETMIALAHNIGLTVVAEGVETREQLTLLREAGCDKVQGHLFGEPLSAESVELLMRRPSRDVPLLL